MNRTTQLAIRVPDEMLERIERYATAGVANHPEWMVSRASTIRALIEKALTDSGYAKKSGKKNT